MTKRDTEAEYGVCGVICTLGDEDCFCGLPPHPEDVPHVCLAVGCGRTWTGYPLLGVATA